MYIKILFPIFYRRIRKIKWFLYYGELFIIFIILKEIVFVLFFSQVNQALENRHW